MFLLFSSLISNKKDSTSKHSVNLPAKGRCYWLDYVLEVFIYQERDKVARYFIKSSSYIGWLYI